MGKFPVVCHCKLQEGAFGLISSEREKSRHSTKIPYYPQNDKRSS